MKLVFKFLKSLPQLTRLGVSVAVTFSAATGYIVFKEELDSGLLYTAIGVLFLAGGASALNQYQEKDIDALMNRTKNRPIPSNKISSTIGLVSSVLLCVLGFTFLYSSVGFIPALLGLFNLIWYNGLYTFLKRKTAFAVVPGSLTGVTPIVIGWTAAGGNMLHPTIILISFFIYMWQIPHFWLLLIKYNDDYQNAGLGNLYQSFSKEQIKRVVFAWIVSTAWSALLLAYFRIVQSTSLVIFLIILNSLVIISFYILLFNKSNLIKLKQAFVGINVFMFAVMIILIVDYLF